MKKKRFRNIFIVSGLFVVFLFPLLIETANAHWAETDVAQLSRNYELGAQYNISR